MADLVNGTNGVGGAQLGRKPTDQDEPIGAEGVVQEDRAWLCDDIWLSIPRYLHRSIQAAHRDATRTPDPKAAGVEREAIAFLAAWYDWNGEPRPWWDALSVDEKRRALRASAALRAVDAATSAH